MSTKRLLPPGGSLDVLFLIALLWGILFWLTPFQFDDWQFMGVYRDHNGGVDDFSLRAWMAYCDELRTYDNGRLSNILSPLTTLWSPWKYLFPWLTGIAVALIVWCAARVGLGSRVGWTGVGVMWFAVAVFLPWRDSLLVRDYALNYVWGAVVAFGAIWLMTRPELKGWRFWLSIPALVGAGFWHEGFAVPTICGLGVVAILRGFRMPGRWWILLCVYTLSCALMTLSPGMLSRSSAELGANPNPMGLRYLNDIFLFCVLVLSTLVCLLSKGGRSHLRDLIRRPYFPLFFTAAVVGVVISLMVTYTPRVCFWPALCSLVALGMLARSLWFGLRRWLRGLAGLLAIGLCAAHLLYVIDWQIRFHHEALQIEEGLDMSPTGTVYYDVIPKRAVSPLTLYYPSRLAWITPFNISSMGHAKGNRNLAVVPEALAGAPTPAPAGIFHHNGALYCQPPFGYLPPSGEPLYIVEPASAEITLSDGSVVPSTAVPLYFYTSPRGDTLLHLALPDVEAERVRSIKLNHR